MSSVYKTEEEQIDDLKRWVKSYGPSILVGIVLAIALLYGSRYWKEYKHNRATQASALYQQAVDAYQTKHPELLQKAIGDLQDKYPHSPYAQYALFIQAKISADKQDYNTASAALNWIISNSRDTNIQSIAKLRLASVQIEQHQEDLAIKTLQSIKNPAFKGLALIKIADAYTVLGDTKNAKINYEAANQLLPDAGNTMPTLAIKLDNATAT